MNRASRQACEAKTRRRAIVRAVTASDSLSVGVARQAARWLPPHGRELAVQRARPALSPACRDCVGSLAGCGRSYRHSMPQVAAETLSLTCDGFVKSRVAAGLTRPDATRRRRVAWSHAAACGQPLGVVRALAVRLSRVTTRELSSIVEEGTLGHRPRRRQPRFRSTTPRSRAATPRFATTARAASVADLGSSNGTYVNGQPDRRAAAADQRRPACRSAAR